MIGRKIKERREELGMSQEQLAKALGIGKSAVSNYETNISSPKETILLKMFSVLKCDANYFYEDYLRPSEELALSSYEKRIIEKYRTLDEYGRKTVDNVINSEYERCIALRTINDSTLVLVNVLINSDGGKNEIQPTCMTYGEYRKLGGSIEGVVSIVQK